ncbi:unnamed protein product [Brassicogethes aeneus]|uniref:Uncharacterized protein n=1 Tax=Brassicogethes aeneus TaxID=1431903 RepID=A0A9P0AW19_BRAAE|nr:unnamed protein product [Brassicogethes aeneus]
MSKQTSGQASGSATEVITNECIDGMAKKLTLVLREKGEELSKDKLKEPTKAQNGFFQNFKDFFQSEANEMQETVEKAKAEKSSTEKNKQKLEAMFNKMQKKLEDQKQEAMEALDTMTEDEQEEFLSFWGQFFNFFMELFNWLKELVYKIIEGIKQGLKLVGNAIKKCFDGIIAFFKNMFS